LESRSWWACAVARGLPTRSFLRELRFTERFPKALP
jgi:hypothetical protein